VIGVGEFAAGIVMGFFGSVPVAGPVALVVLTKGLRAEFGSARKVALGAGVAEGLLGASVFAGLGFATAKFGRLEAVLDFTGVAVLLFVGLWFVVRGVGGGVGKEDGASSVDGSSAQIIWLGALMVLGNPGMLGTWGGAVAALEGAGLIEASVAGAPFFGAGVCIGVLSWFWLGLFAIKRWSSSLDGRWVDFGVRGTGVALIFLGISAGIALLGGADG
jgi:threonine/homoserine/homoserine lactone efflux protein